MKSNFRPLRILKFGGSSVANAEKIKFVANKIIRIRKQGYKIVAVVSAQGDTTDNLITLAKEVTSFPDDREMDVLLSTGEQISVALLTMAIKSLGFTATSLTGHQIGIHTDFAHTKARIIKIKPVRLKKALEKDKIVIVPGFQGINPKSDITTLGRGGSDLTAVALAAVLKPEFCEIYTDVDGVYTADPRIVRGARRIDAICYDEMFELAGSGAQVMQPRSIELAKKFNVNILVKPTFSESKGTLITKEAGKMEEPIISGISYDKDQAKLSITNVPDKPGVAAKIFSDLAKKEVNVDMIIQSAARNGHSDISFTVSRADIAKALPILKKEVKRMDAEDVICDMSVAKISAIGIGMRTHPGVAAKMFKSLAQKKINIEMIATSEIKISCIVKEKHIKKAIRTLHSTFGLS